MELRHLHYFLAVAEELHFGRAAERLHISQPPLSQQIRELEQELGVRLFARTSRSVRLTPAGEAFRLQVRQVFAQVDQAVGIARAVERGEAGGLCVGFCAPAMDGPLPFALKAFGEQFPGVRLDLREARTPELLEALRQERIDVGVVRLVDEQPDGLETELFLREPYLLAVPEGHRLCGASGVALRELEDEALLMVPHTHRSLHTAILLALEKAGVRVRIVREVASKQTMAALTVAGAGVCFLPASMKTRGREGLRFLPLADAFPLVEIFTAWKKGNANTALRNFVRLLRGYHRDSHIAPKNLTHKDV